MKSVMVHPPTSFAELIDGYFPVRPQGYLDTASIGLVPVPVGAAVTEAYRALGEGTRGAHRWHAVVERTHQVYADEFGVAENEVGFMASTAEAINAIAHAIPWQADDEVLVLKDEFPTVILPWAEPQRHGVRVVRVQPLPGDDRLGALLAGIGPRTRVVAVSHVSSYTGTRVDLDALGAACHAVGALLVCDGAQAAGCVPVDLTAVDFYIATGYKWLLGGFGIAVVVAKQTALAELRPAFLGRDVAPPSPRLSYGHVNIPGVYALHEAAAVRQALGHERIHQRVAELTQSIRTGVTDLGYTTAGRPGEEAGIVSVAGLPDAKAAVASLAATGVAVAARDGYLRISPYVYTDDDEVLTLLDALAGLPADVTRKDPL